MTKFRSTLFFCFTLTACGGNSTPDVKDIKQNIVEYWNTCPAVKTNNFNKTNGIPNNDGSYTLEYSYNIEMQKDYGEGVNDVLKDGGCPNPQAFLALMSFISQSGNGADLTKVKKGYTMTINASALMVKSEKGWISR